MNLPLLVYLLILACCALGVAIFFRTALKNISDAVGAHATTYAIPYIKGGCLIFIAGGTAFEQKFQPLTSERAAQFAWWDWVIFFQAPLLAGLAVLVAFLDKSIATATAAKESKSNEPA